MRRRFDKWAAVGTDTLVLQHYTADLRAVLFPPTLAANGPTAVDYVDYLTQLLRQWLDTLASAGSRGRFPDVGITNLLEYLIDERPGRDAWRDPTEQEALKRLKAFRLTLCDYPHPAVRLYGFSVKDSPDAFLERVYQTLDEQAVNPVNDYRNSCYAAALDGLGGPAPGSGVGPVPSEVRVRYLSLARFMLKRKEVVNNVLFAATDIRENGNPAVDDAACALVTDALAVMADPHSQTLDTDKEFVVRRAKEMRGSHRTAPRRGSSGESRSAVARRPPTAQAGTSNGV